MHLGGGGGAPVPGATLPDGREESMGRTDGKEAGEAVVGEGRPGPDGSDGEGSRPLALPMASPG